jgi:signal peptidase II
MKAVPASRWVVFLSIVVGGCGLDLATKHWMFGRPNLLSGQTCWVCPDVFGFQINLNDGALFGMGQGMTGLFAVLSVAAAVGIVYWLFYAGAAHDRLLTIALACITAGILGNLYDRLGLPGLVWRTANPHHQVGDAVHAVRDWILVMIGTHPWPTFNIADSLLVCGAFLLAVHALGSGSPQPSCGEATGDGCATAHAAKEKCARSARER